MQRYASNHSASEFASTAEPAGSTAAEGAARGRDWHKYLGYTTVALALAAGPTNSQKSLHYALAYSSAAAAVATVVTGWRQHRDDLPAEEGLLTNGYKRHALLGVLGALAMVTAVSIADSGDNGGHSAIGIAGASLMTLSVIDLHW
jgi:hypothetical protein